MSKIKRLAEILPIGILILLLMAGCRIRLATKEDWVTAAPSPSATYVIETDAVAAVQTELPQAESPTAAPQQTVDPTVAPRPEKTAVVTASPKQTVRPSPTAPRILTSPATLLPSATPIPMQTFTISIEGPEETILSGTQIQYEGRESKTVADVTLDICNRFGITVISSRKRFNKLFIESFNDIGTGLYGNASGWIYYVNGIVPMFGVEDYTVRDGDVIEWKYTRS